MSVVIPCYNYGRFLPQAVASALAQDGVEVDVLVVDDASSDGSDQVALEIARSDPRVDVLLHETNAGHIQTYNDGLAKASGEYVVLLSADDLLAPGSLTRSVALMEAHPEVVLVYGLASDFTSTPPPPRTRVRNWSTWDGEDWLKGVCTRGRNPIVNPEAVLRTSVMHELVGYRSEHPHAADMELWMRAAAHGRVGRVNGPDQAYYRIHPNNMHSTEFGGLLPDLTAVHRVFVDFFDSGVGPLPPSCERMRDKAGRSIARDALRAACVRLDSSSAEGRAEAIGLGELAVECWPRILDTPLGRSYSARLHQRPGPIGRETRRRREAVRWALRSRRSRRWGL